MMLRRVLSIAIACQIAVIGARAEDPLSRPKMHVVNPQLASLVLSTDIGQREITLTEDQKTRLRNVEAARAKAVDDIWRNRNASLPANKTEAESSNELAAIHRDAQKEIEGVLLPSQARRLDQILLQLFGPTAFEDAAILDALAITTDQKAKIDQILRGRSQAMKNLIVSSGSNVPQVVSPKWHEQRLHVLAKEKTLNDTALNHISQLLTSKQLDLLSEIRGKAIDVGTLNEQLLNAPVVPPEKPIGRLVPLEK